MDISRIYAGPNWNTLPTTNVQSASSSAPATPRPSDSVAISASFDERIHQVVTTIYSARTGEVIQELPPSGIREFAATVRSKLAESTDKDS